MTQIHEAHPLSWPIEVDSNSIMSELLVAKCAIESAIERLETVSREPLSEDEREMYDRVEDALAEIAHSMEVLGDEIELGPTESDLIFLFQDHL